MNNHGDAGLADHTLSHNSAPSYYCDEWRGGRERERERQTDQPINLTVTLTIVMKMPCLGGGNHFPLVSGCHGGGLVGGVAGNRGVLLVVVGVL